MLARLLILALVLGGSTPALGQLDTSRMPDKAQQVSDLYKQLYFVKASKACEQALKQGGNTRRELVYLLGFKGLIAAAQGRTAAGVASFKRMLAVDPRAKLMPGQSPRIVRAFKRAQAWVAEQDPIAVASSAPTSAARGSRATISLTLASDPFRMATRATLHVRPVGGQSYRPQKTQPIAAARWELDLGATAPAAPAVEYHLTVTDADNNVVAFVGQPAQPKRITLLGSGSASGATKTAPPPAQTAWYKTWPVWTIVGVTTVALIVGVTVGVSASSSDRADVPVTIGVRP
jgi:hypothetical protein